MQFLRGVVFATLAMLAGGVAQAQGAVQDDPDYIAFSAGAFDVGQDDRAAEFQIQYRSDYKLWLVKPHGGVMATSDGSVYGFAGVLIDIYFGNRWVLTPSTAVGGYHAGGGKDMGHALQFRWGGELAYRFDDRSRLGVGVYHMSNANIADHNPGAESALLSYSMPLSKLFGR